jgi:hypothetical protein
MLRSLKFKLPARAPRNWNESGNSPSKLLHRRNRGINHALVLGLRWSIRPPGLNETLRIASAQGQYVKLAEYFKFGIAIGLMMLYSPCMEVR